MKKKQFFKLKNVFSPLLECSLSHCIVQMSKFQSDLGPHFDTKFSKRPLCGGVKTDYDFLAFLHSSISLRESSGFLLKTMIFYLESNYKIVVKLGNCFKPAIY